MLCSPVGNWQISLEHATGLPIRDANYVDTAVISLFALSQTMLSHHYANGKCYQQFVLPATMYILQIKL